MSEYNRHSLAAVLASGIGLALAYGTVVLSTFGLFLTPIAQEFGWNLTRTSALVSASAFTQAPCSLLVGFLLDRFGVRRMVLPGIVLYGIGVMALAAASGNSVQAYALFMLVGALSSPATMLAYSKIVTAWFSRKRAFMLSVYAVLAATIGSAVPQIARRLIEAYGWRDAYLGLGGMVIAVGFPVMFFLLREPAVPGTSGRPGSGPGRVPPLPASEPVLSAAQVRRSPVYWQIMAAITLCTLALTGIGAHTVPMLVERGLSRVVATDILSLYALSSMAGQLAMGWALDRTRSPRIAAPVVALNLAGLAVLYWARSPDMAVVGGILQGLSSGSELSLGKFLYARYFGSRAFGEIFGLQVLFIGLSAGLGPVMMAATHDATGNYRLGLLLLGGLIAIASILILRLPRYEAVLTRHASPSDPHALELRI
ncbi:MAG: MFS transporter [Pseudoxanthomonas sp.]